MNIDNIINETINNYIGKTQLNEYAASPDVLQMLGNCMNMVGKTYQAVLNDIQNNKNGSKNEYIIGELYKTYERLQFIFKTTNPNKNNQQPQRRTLNKQPLQNVSENKKSGL